MKFKTIKNIVYFFFVSTVGGAPCIYAWGASARSTAGRRLTTLVHEKLIIKKGFGRTTRYTALS